MNGRRVDRPSYRLQPGDVITIAERSRRMDAFQIAAAHAENVPPYLDVRHDALAAQLTRLPERKEIPVICDEQLVVEHYSR